MDEKGHTVEMHEPEPQVELNPPAPPESTEGAVSTGTDNNSKYSLDLSGSLSDQFHELVAVVMDLTYDFDACSNTLLSIIKSNEMRAKILADMEARLRMREQLWRLYFPD